MPDLSSASSHDTIYPGWTTSTTRPALVRPESDQLVFGNPDLQWAASLSIPDPAVFYRLSL